MTMKNMTLNNDVKRGVFVLLRTIVEDALNVSIDTPTENDWIKYESGRNELFKVELPLNLSNRGFMNSMFKSAVIQGVIVLDSIRGGYTLCSIKTYYNWKDGGSNGHDLFVGLYNFNEAGELTTKGKYVMLYELKEGDECFMNEGLKNEYKIKVEKIEMEDRYGTPSEEHKVYSVNISEINKKFDIYNDMVVRIEK